MTTLSPCAPSPVDSWLAARMGLSEMDAGAVLAWQMKELRQTLAWAVDACPFHARRLAGVDLSTLTTPAALAALPRMTAEDLAAPGLLSVSQDEVERVVTLPSSGTTGPAKRLSFSEADLNRTLDFFAVGMSTLCGARDTVLVLLPGRSPWGVANLLALALPDIGARALTPPDFPRDVPLAESLPELLAEGVTSLVAAPTQLAQLLELPADLFRGRLRTLLSTGEPLPASLRRRLAEAWGCEVFDHWGMTETGYGGGVECRAHAGYHLREADLFVEIADFDTGVPLPDGETGEILVTTLGERAMPLVRYRTGDAARMLPPPCPCGGRLRRLDAVCGRLGPHGEIREHLPKGWVQNA